MSFTPATTVSFLVALLIGAALWAIHKAVSLASRRDDRIVFRFMVTQPQPAEVESKSSTAVHKRRKSFRPALFMFGLSTLLAAFGFHAAGPLGAVVAGGAGLVTPRLIDRRRHWRKAERLEEQLTEMTEAISMGVRSGLSIPQALELAASEADQPMADVLSAVLAERRLGFPLETALNNLAEALPTNETRLLALVLGLHARTGGNLASALDEVTASIRERGAVRRDLHALTAQARMSGAILSSLPLGLFAVLAVTSGSELSPVLRSGMGTALVGSGLVLEAIAYVWIRRLLRVGK